MPVKKYKPTTPCRRFMSMVTDPDIQDKISEKSLVKPLKQRGGRNNLGRITSRHKGGGHKRRFRIIDFIRSKFGIPAKVAAIEYDPNRSANIALLHYSDGEKRYILAPVGLKQGDAVISDHIADVRPGNAMQLQNIPLGTLVHNIEMRPGKGAQIVRSAGTAAQVVAKEGKYVQLRLPSGEVRMIYKDCMAVIGQVGNIEHENVSFGKAGKSRWLGRRPKVRGVAMNPVDHPMGGGEGKSSGGRHPCTPWGKPTKGYKTRKPNLSDPFIIKKRK